MPKKLLTLIERYTILKPKLEKGTRLLNDYRLSELEMSDIYNILEGQARLNDEALELLTDTFSGEDEEVQ